MAQSRLDLHTKLEKILGSEHVYFQPPSTIKMKYPCIIYKRDDSKEFFANDQAYMNMKRYSIKVVDQNPDSEIPDRVSKMRYCSFATHFVVDNLNHDVYSLYF